MLKFSILFLAITAICAISAKQCTITPLEKYFPVTFTSEKNAYLYNYPQILNPVKVDSFYCTYNGSIFCEVKPHLPPNIVVNSLSITCMKVETGPLRRTMSENLLGTDLVEIGSCSLRYSLHEIVSVINSRITWRTQYQYLERRLDLLPLAITVIIVIWMTWFLIKLIISSGEVVEETDDDESNSSSDSDGADDSVGSTESNSSTEYESQN